MAAWRELNVLPSAKITWRWPTWQFLSKTALFCVIRTRKLAAARLGNWRTSKLKVFLVWFIHHFRYPALKHFFAYRCNSGSETKYYIAVLFFEVFSEIGSGLQNIWLEHAQWLNRDMLNFIVFWFFFPQVEALKSLFVCSGTLCLQFQSQYHLSNFSEHFRKYQLWKLKIPGMNSMSGS